MNAINAIIAFPMSIILWIFLITGGIKERGLRAKYWGYGNPGAFGRPKAFFFMLSILYVIAFTVVGIISFSVFNNLVSPTELETENALVPVIGSIIIVISFALVALWIGISSIKKCPGHLKGGVMGAMFIAGWGVFAKLILTMTLIFLPIIGWIILAYSWTSIWE